jgi:hypothetical protein
MNVKELRKLLKKLPGNMEIILQKDAEGNGYSPLYDADPDAIYVEETTWSGHVYYTGWTAEECCMDEDEYEEMLKHPRVLVLEPVN